MHLCLFGRTRLASLRSDRIPPVTPSVGLAKTRTNHSYPDPQMVALLGPKNGSGGTLGKAFSKGGVGWKCRECENGALEY